MRRLSFVLAVAIVLGAVPGRGRADGPPAGEPDRQASTLATRMLLRVYSDMAGGRTSVGIADDLCGCRFDGDGNVLQPNACEPIERQGREDLAGADVVRVVPLSGIAESLACFREGDGICVDSGMRYGGVECCRRSSGEYWRRAADPHLLLLAPMPVAREARELRVAREVATRQPWAACEVAFGDRTIALPARLSGFVARALLYAAWRYQVSVGFPTGLLRRLSAAYPPSGWEIERNESIDAVTGYGRNPYIAAPPAEDE